MHEILVYNLQMMLQLKFPQEIFDLQILMTFQLTAVQEYFGMLFVGDVTGEIYTDDTIGYVWHPNLL